MDIDLRRYFWLTTAITLVSCAYFAAITVNHLIDGTVLSDTAEFEPNPVSETTVAAKEPVRRSKSSGAWVARNMFCSLCESAAMLAVSGVAASGEPPITRLPLRLVATNISTQDSYSFATIQNTSSQREGAYSLTNTIPGGGVITSISVKYVDFENTASHRVERIPLLAVAEASPLPKQQRTRALPQNAKEELAALIDSGVQRRSDTEFELDRKVVDKLLENPSGLMRGARFRPNVKEGKTRGFKIFAVRTNSPFSKIGLKSGDLLRSVNGMELNSLDAGLKIFSTLQSSSNFSLDIERRGKPISLNYTVR